MALRPIEQDFVLDIANEPKDIKIWATQSCKRAFKLKTTIVEEGIPLELSDVDITFRVRLPHGEVLTTVLDESSDKVVIDRDYGIIELIPDDVLFERNGQVHCEFELEDTAGGVLIKTPTFVIFVLESIQE